ncbi:MAG: hypothetical protein H0X15_07735 [Acidobacteria bacterium]|jgi:hypothetical protein|nr:hypothetical protein [Acidobacteriota bacterium]MBA4122827.1 hypothetical protein [Acidobacteriota bacterium]
MKKLFIAFGLMLLCSVLINARISNVESTPSMPESRCTVPKTATKDREFNCLKGNVHTVKSEAAVFVKKNGQYVKTAVSQTHIVTYDKQGNMIESLTYGSKDYDTKSSVHRIVYNFNSEGVATGWEEYYEGKQIPVKDVYTYDNKGKRIKQTVTYTEYNEQSILILIYDSQGNKVEERSYYPVSIIKDSNQTDTSIEKYLDRFTKYKYDGKNLIQTTNYSKDGSISYKEISTYENGNLKENIGYSADAKGELVRSNRNTFRYDNKGNIIEKIIYNKDDSIQSKTVYGFDEQGYKISEIIYDSNGMIKNQSALKYEYDSQGNWLSYTSDDLKFSERINAGEPFPLELRTITYY